MLHSWTGWGILGVDYSITSTFSCVFENSYNNFFFWCIWILYQNCRVWGSIFHDETFHILDFDYYSDELFYISKIYVFENFKLQLIFSIFSAFEKVFTKEKREKFVDRRLGLLEIHVTT